MKPENKLDQLEKICNKMSDHLIRLDLESHTQIKKYEQIIIDSMEINNKLHRKTLDVESQFKLFDKRLDRELDTYLNKLSLLEHKVNQLLIDMDFQHKACETRHAISIHPEPDKLIDELKDKQYYQTEEDDE
jgi:hypothetical protein